MLISFTDTSILVEVSGPKWRFLVSQGFTPVGPDLLKAADTERNSDILDKAMNLACGSCNHSHEGLS